MSTKRAVTPMVLMYRPNQVAKMLGLSRSTVDRLIRTGELEAHKMPGGRSAPVLIPAAALRAFEDRLRAVS